ncbi:hypothetical protein CTEN210_03943 [Chaetoceros tenuissimus]|uniref:Uncharacterized protein n=1 Tax=Chaetoceros tenuissimus TaxID=426638 RepID=A0AAD3CKA1_9STRA|nr:hypothetical protein CTEN210_03943 [Chaetoceros tenuissimus]
MSKRSSTSNDKSSQKKQKKEQASMFNFFDLTKDDDNEDEKKSASSAPPAAKKKYKIFCDLDGVLVDFEGGVRRINRGKGPDDLSPGQLWSSVARAHKFFLNLSWTKDGKELWSRIVQEGYVPDILTGLPNSKGAAQQKFDWCRKELNFAFAEQGKNKPIFNHIDYANAKRAHSIKTGARRKGENVVNVLTCWSRNKHCESAENHVLIDDREDLGEKWRAKGGIFIHHTSTANSIQQMVKLGIFNDGNDNEDAKKRKHSEESDEADDESPQKKIKAKTSNEPSNDKVIDLTE